MNTFGKILVICNLLVALCVPAFFMAVRNRQTNWKEAVDSLKQQLEVARSNSEAKDPDIQKLNKEAKEQQANANMITKQQQVDRENFKDLLDSEKVKVRALEVQLTQESLKLAREQQETERLRLESDGHAKAVEQYAKDKIDLQEEMNKYRKEAATFRNEKDQWHDQAKNLANIVREYEARIRDLASSGSGGGMGAAPGSNIVKNPNDPNPPRVKVQGRVLQVSPDVNDGAGLLVRLSIGSDHGIRKDHTLECYRTVPDAQYLGRLRVIEVTANDCIARLVSRNAAGGQLRVNDVVVDNLSSR